MIDFETYLDNELDEKVARVAMIRNGKKIFKWIDDRPGYRIQYDKDGNHKSVKMKFKEKLKRRLAQRLKGKNKRKSKAKLIQKRRARAFSLRKNIGLSHYNKRNPQKRTGSNLFKTVKKQIKKSKNTLKTISKQVGKLIHPKTESFIEYLKNPNILNESPHTYLIDRNDYEICWDFYEEDVGISWFEQLITLYRDHYIDSVRPNGNIDSNNEIINHIEFDDDEIDDITINLIHSFEFIAYAHKDILNCDKPVLDNLKKYLPDKLFAKIIYGN